jgi:CubicO group peptidase (beta-lactamase class C family)
MANDVERMSAAVDAIAVDVGLSGVIRIDLDVDVVIERSYGMAQRGLGVANNAQTRFAMASGSKLFTALAVMVLAEEGVVALDSPIRPALGGDLPMIDDRVTVEHLLSHRSGIGDYLDESTVTDWNEYLMPVPVHQLATTEQFLPVLDHLPMKFEPDERFEYSNGGYVVLALVAERLSGVPFHDLVEQRVCVPAGMTRTSYLRSDELPGDAAVGYLHDEGLRCNVLHLPVRGNGDGGAYTTAADMHAFWASFLAGRIVATETAVDMMRVRTERASNGLGYGLGCWLDPVSGAVSVHGFDPGVGVVSAIAPSTGVAHTVLCNQGRGAWPTAQRIEQLVARGGEELQ